VQKNFTAVRQKKEDRFFCAAFCLFAGAENKKADPKICLLEYTSPGGEGR